MTWSDSRKLTPRLASHMPLEQQPSRRAAKRQNLPIRELRIAADNALALSGTFLVNLHGTASANGSPPVHSVCLRRLTRLPGCVIFESLLDR